MLHAVMLADDEKPVVPAAPAPTKADLDRRDIQRKLIRNWSTVYHLLVDRAGKPTGCEHLNPQYKPNPDGFVRHSDPRLVEFCGPDTREETLGAWFCRGGYGARGDNLFELVMYLGQCDFRTATVFLKDIADRLVEIRR
jgi:hypothetical protein